MSERASITLNDVRRALTLPGFDALAAQQRMAPQSRLFAPNGSKPRLAGVLVLLYPGALDRLHFVLIRRTEYPGVHSGQISLPGGRREGEESLEQTALRETEEEVGARADGIEMLGGLASLYVPPSDFDIHPFVGYTPVRPAWRPQMSEVAEIIEMPLDRLLDDGAKDQETLQRGDLQISILFYRVGQHKVWGATAIILSELEMRLRTAPEQR
jgi:8-oxo-dGTP pyrophosphatase MutT (NUDIX family)